MDCAHEKGWTGCALGQRCKINNPQNNTIVIRNIIDGELLDFMEERSARLTSERLAHKIVDDVLSKRAEQKSKFGKLIIEVRWEMDWR